MVPGAKNHFLVVGRYSIIHGVNIYLYICTCVFYVRPFCGVIDWDSGILGGGSLFFVNTHGIYFPVSFSKLSSFIGMVSNPYPQFIILIICNFSA